MSAYVAFAFASLSLLAGLPSFVATESNYCKPARYQQVRPTNRRLVVSKRSWLAEPAVLMQASVSMFFRLYRSLGIAAWAVAKWSAQYLT